MILDHNDMKVDFCIVNIMHHICHEIVVILWTKLSEYLFANFRQTSYLPLPSIANGDCITAYHYEERFPHSSHSPSAIIFYITTAYMLLSKRIAKLFM